MVCAAALGESSDMAGNRETFLLVGNGTYANRGCEAIVRGTVEILSRRFPDASFIVSSRGDTAFEDAEAERDRRVEHRPHLYDAVRKFSGEWWKYRVWHRRSTGWRHLVFRVEYAAIRRSVCGLQVGGDNYTLDYGRPEFQMHMDEALRTAGKPLVLWGASVGPFSEDPAFEETMREHLSRFQLILARESETLSYLHSMGLTSNVRFVADPAFLMEPVKPQLAEDVMRILEGKPVGVNLSPLVGDYRGDKGSGWLEAATQCVRSLLEAGIGPVLLIPHVTWPISDDYAFMARIAEGLAEYKGHFTLLPPTLPAPETKWVISKLRALVGARTHATIAALSTGVPTISIGYSTKARGINKDMFGHPDWLLPVQDLTPALLLTKLADLLSGENEIRAGLAEVLPAVKSRARQAGEYLAQVLEGQLV